MMPLVSVVIPACNAADTIRQTLQSVLVQTHRELEIIVIDDGSTDHTAAIVRAIPDTRIQILSTTNAGPAAARNRGAELSRGEYVSFLDADDLWTPDKISAQVNALANRSNAGVAYSWTDYIDALGAYMYPGRHRSEEGDVYAAMLCGDFLENGSNALIRREVADTLGGFNEKVPRGSEDWEYYIRAARITEFVCVRKPQVLYRVRPASVSSSIPAQLAGLLEMIEIAYAQVPPALRDLRRQTEGHIYFHLAQKALDLSDERRKSVLSMNLLSKALLRQPSLLVQPGPVAATVIKALASVILPQKITRRLLQAARKRRTATSRC